MLDCEYELKVKEIDDLIIKKENNKVKEFIEINDNIEPCQKDKRIIEKKKKGSHFTNLFHFNKRRNNKQKFNDEKIVTKHNQEDDLFEEIYGKFGGNYNDLVEEHTQLMLKFEMNKKEDKTKYMFITMISLFVGWLMILTFFFI